MPITRRLLPCAVAIMLVAAGCAVHRDNARQVAPPEKPNIESMAVHYYTSNFTCTAEGLTANGQLRMQPDSVIWLSASKVIELARACFTRDSVIIYAKVMGRSFRGDYEDLYRRFHLRTDFDQLYQDVTAEDAGERLSAMAQQLGAEVTIMLQPWKEVSQLTFPIPVPNNTNPL